MMTIGKLTDKVQSVIDKSNLELEVINSETDRNGYNSFCKVTVSGGKNGNGKWADYFSSLSKFTDAVEANGMEIWLVKMYNDVLDDVFYATFGIKCEE